MNDRGLVAFEDFELARMRRDRAVVRVAPREPAVIVILPPAPLEPAPRMTPVQMLRDVD